MTPVACRLAGLLIFTLCTSPVWAGYGLAGRGTPSASGHPRPPVPTHRWANPRPPAGLRRTAVLARPAAPAPTVVANSAATPSQHPVRLPSPQAVLRRLRARLHIFGDADGGGCLPGDDRFRIDDKKGFDLKSASCELSCQAYRWRDQKKSADLFGDIHLTAGPVHYTLVSNFATYHVDKHLLEMHGLVRVVAAGKGAAAPNVRTGDTGLVHVDRPSGPQIIVR